MFGELKKPQSKYIWTAHSQYKMRQYRLSESLVKRVIRFPARVEESIVEDTIAVMRPAQSKNYSEIWAMYAPTKDKKLRIITTWRYPGKSPERDPIPQDILNEVRSILF
ncbi:MAG: hypothetical protein WD850_02730 [Candidatus Spechtbacterales bacterium]